MSVYGQIWITGDPITVQQGLSSKDRLVNMGQPYTVIH